MTYKVKYAKTDGQGLYWLRREHLQRELQADAPALERNQIRANAFENAKARVANLFAAPSFAPAFA